MGSFADGAHLQRLTLGGWPMLSDTWVSPRQRVPHPCVLCKGGYRGRAVLAGCGREVEVEVRAAYPFAQNAKGWGTLYNNTAGKTAAPQGGPPPTRRRDARSPTTEVSSAKLRTGAGLFLLPLRGFTHYLGVPQLALWAAFWRRFAAGFLEVGITRP
jgi:hypothetical protein